jgi:hypothetical protein
MLRLLSAGLVAGLLLAAPLQAQSARPGSFSVTPYAGYMKFGNLVDGPFGASIRGAAGPVYGAEATLGITRGLALVGNLAYASTSHRANEGNLPSQFGGQKNQKNPVGFI